MPGSRRSRCSRTSTPVCHRTSRRSNSALSAEAGGAGRSPTKSSRSASKPGSTRRRLASVRPTSPAPTTHTNATATCPVTMSRRALPVERLPPARAGLPLRSVASKVLRAMISAGARPKTNTDATVTRTAKASTPTSSRTSSNRASPAGAKVTPMRSSAAAIAIPRKPPMAARTNCSVISCATSRPGRAPRADRIASS